MKTPLKSPLPKTRGLRRGNPGNKGGGRPLDEFKKKCQEMANSPKMLLWLRDIVNGDIVVDSETRLKAWDRLCDRGYGKPAQMLSNDPENPFDSAIFVMPAKSVGHKGGIS